MSEMPSASFKRYWYDTVYICCLPATYRDAKYDIVKTLIPEDPGGITAL